jgi:hypothetical protein
MSILITTSMALLFSTVVACNSKEARTHTPGRVVPRSRARFARHGKHLYTPRRRGRWQPGPQARLGGHTARSEPALARKINCIRSLRLRVENSRARCNTRVARSWASVLRPLGAGTLLAFGDHSAAPAPMAMSPSRRSSAHECWEFRVPSKHSHCLGWRISVATALMT